MSDGPVRSGRRARGMLEDLRFDLRFGLRGLRRSPTFAAVAVVTIALGIGATTSMLSIGHAVLFRPPPVAEPDRMVSIWEFRSGWVSEGIEGRLLPYARLEAYREATRDLFDGLVGHAYTSFAVGTEAGAVPTDGFVTSGDYFAVLGLAPRLGRFYEGDDEASVVLSHRLWTSRFGADPDVIGRPISITSRRFTVTGIAPPGFTGTMAGFGGDVWVPAGAYARLTGLDGDGVPVVPIGRLRPGAHRSFVQERVDAVARAIPAREGTTVRGARLDGLLWRGDLRRTLNVGIGMVAAAAGLLLLIACVNVAGMTLARSYDRRREVAVRLAIGVGPGRLVRQLLTESVLLALIGGVGGVLLAVVGTAALSGIRVPVGATVDVDLLPDPWILLAAFGIATLTGVLFGLGPALLSARTDLAVSLKEGARGPGLGRRSAVFVAGQVALSTVLLVAAGLFLRSFTAVADVPLGFDPDGVTVAVVSVGGHGYGPEEARTFYDQLLDRVRSEPGVEGVGLGRYVLLGGSNASNRATAADGGEDAPSTSVGYNLVDPAYFRVNRIEPLEGRLLTDSDVEGSPAVAVVNKTLAERFWPGRSAVGRRFRSGGVEREVVGVVPDGVYVFQNEARQAFAFYPFAQEYRSTMALHVRADGTLDGVGGTLRRAVRDLDPDIAVEDVRTMAEVVAANRFGHRFLAWLTSLFAGVGLILAAVGVYGVLAVWVARRGREFAVRRALGARAGQVMLLVLGRGTGTAALGCLLGLTAALAAGRILTSLLYEVSPFDAVTFAVVPAVLLGTAVVASVVPARRATRVDPTETLREE